MNQITNTKCNELAMNTNMLPTFPNCPTADNASVMNIKPLGLDVVGLDISSMNILQHDIGLTKNSRTDVPAMYEHILWNLIANRYHGLYSSQK
jgi:hypothetical protein